MEAVKQTSKHNSVMAASQAAGKNAVPALFNTPPKMLAKPSVAPTFIQAKLQVNKPGDSYEQEANATADRVMRMQTGQSDFNIKQAAPTGHTIHTFSSKNVPPIISRLVAKPGLSTSTLYRKCTHCNQEDKLLQRKETGGRTPHINAVLDRMGTMEGELNSRKGGGQPLAPATNAMMSKAIGADFTGVRIHTDSKAASLSQGINAYAFTYGKDIYFSTNMYQPDTAVGQHLLAHELTHVVQQGYAPVVQHGANTLAATPATLQRLALSDLEDLNPLNASIDDLVRRYMPELLDIKNSGGILPWLENKITGAIESMLNAAVAPVKGAVDFVSNLSPTMVKIITWIKTTGTKISKNDCSSFTELADMVRQLADELAAPAIEKIKLLSQKVSGWFSTVWEKFGLPIWDFIKQYIGNQWELIKSLGNKIWEKTQPIRDWAATVWIQFKNWLGIGDGPDGQNGIIQWIESKLLAVWNKIKEKIEPFKKQILITGGVLVMLSPAGPLIAAGALFTSIVTAANWVRKNIHSPQDIVKLRLKFEKEILPSLVQGLNSAVGGLKQVFCSLADKLGSVVGALGKLTALVADGVLSFIQSALQWITDKFADIAEWGTAKLIELSTWLQQIFAGMQAFATLVMSFLAKVNAVAGDIMSLPSLIVTSIWHKIPLCIRNGIEDFLINTILKNVPYFEDVIALVKYWQKIKAGTIDVIKTVFVTGDLKRGILKAFKLLLDVVGIPVELVTGIYNKALNAFDQVVNKPKIIFQNIVIAIKSGFTQFYNNFLKNAVDALGNWIFSKAKGVKMPKEFTAKSVFGLVMDVLGFTEDNIFKRIELKTSKPFADKLRKKYETLQTTAKWVVQIIKDPKAAYDQAKAKLTDLKDKLFKGIGDWIAKNVIGKFIAQIMAELASTPFGEAIEAIVDAYKMIKTAIEYAEKILRVVDTVLDSVLDLAAGVTAKAAETVEKGLTTGLEVAVAFIAKVLNIGDLPQQVSNVVEENIRPTIDTAIDGVIDNIIIVVKGLKDFAGDVKETLSSAFNWAKTTTPFTSEDGETHSTYIENQSGGPVVMVASTPTPVQKLIAEYTKTNKRNARGLAIANRASLTFTEVQNIALQIAQLDANMLKASPKQKVQLQKAINILLPLLLLAQTALALLLTKTLKGKRYAKFKSIYAIEGLVGMHRWSPKNDEAKFEADHQPSNILISLAAENPVAPALLRQVAKGRSALAFTIVLGDYRHQAGRTFGSKAKPIADSFAQDLNKAFKGERDSNKKRIILEQAFKNAALRDAEAMEAVVRETNLETKQWRDINDFDLNEEEKEMLRSQIQGQVEAGERLIKSSHISITVPSNYE